MARLLVAFLDDLEKRRPEFERWLDHAWIEPAAVPLVFLGPGAGSTRRPSSVMVDLAPASKHDQPMAMPMTPEQRIRQLHEDAIEQLVAAHRQRTDEPLVLAVRYEVGDPMDVHLLEVIDGFPGGDDDELLVTEFEPSAQLRILGKLHLVLGSPAQLQAAIRRNHPLIAAVKTGSVVHDDGSDVAKQLKGELGL